MALLKDWFGWEGPYTAQQRRTEEQNMMKQQLTIIQGDFSDDEKETAARQIIQAVQPKYYEAEIAKDPTRKFYDPILNRRQQQQKALDPYGRQYLRGGTATDPFVQGAVDIGKIQDARDKFGVDITPEMAAYFDTAERSVKDRSGFKEPEINPKTGKPRRIFSKKGEVLGTRTKEGGIDNRGYFSTGQKATEKPTTTPPEDIDYFQAPTATVPEANIQRTYKQMGITNTEDQATFQEMQDAMPEQDMRKEYEDNPELFKELMELWRQKKLNKKNIGKAFSMMQQQARQSLGILS